MTETEQHEFYENLVRKLRARGVVCGITSGLACVHFGVAETTNDCDLLCFPEAFDVLLGTLAETWVEGHRCQYRGNFTPPLDIRWHRGGWTSHFTWGSGLDRVNLDVFGSGLRCSTPWEDELSGLYLSPHIVAEMKRTHRDKDWAVVTALGLKLIQAGDARGWLHIFHHETLQDLLDAHTCPPEVAALRPALKLSLKQDPRAHGALSAERKLWEELDRARIRIYQRSLRPYAARLRKMETAAGISLESQQELRVRAASESLAFQPLKEYGIQKLIQETERSLVESGQIPREALGWLPDVAPHFQDCA